MFGANARFALVGIGIFFVVCVLYLPALQNDFVWDDKMFLQTSSTYMGAGRFAASWFDPFAIYAAYYRPLVLTSFAVYPASFANSAAVQHGVNVLLHASVAVLIYLATLRMLSVVGAKNVDDSKLSLRVAVTCGFIFALHPLTVEPVLWVSGRFDLALTFFCCLFVYVELGNSQGAWRTLQLSLIYFFAATSKETAVAFPIAMLALHTLRWRIEGASQHWVTMIWRNRLTYLAILIGGVAYLALRSYALSKLAVGDLPLHVASWSDRPLLISLALFSYVKLIFIPWLATGPFHYYDLTQFTAVERVLFPFASVLVVGTLALFATRTQRWPWVAFVFLSMLLPVLHLTPFSGAPTLYADRYGMAPLALVLIACAPLIFRFISRARVTTAARLFLSFAAVVVVISWIALARVTTSLWRNDLSLWTYTYSVAPNSSMAASNYLHALLTAGNLAAAEPVAKGILQRGIASLSDLRNIAALYALQNDYDAAYQTLRSIDVYRTRRINDADRASYFCGWAQIDQHTGRWADAVAHTEAAVGLNPNDLECQVSFARSLIGNGELKRAASHLKDFQLKFPDYQREIVVQLLLATDQSKKSEVNIESGERK